MVALQRKTIRLLVQQEMLLGGEQHEFSLYRVPKIAFSVQEHSLKQDNTELEMAVMTAKMSDVSLATESDAGSVHEDHHHTTHERRGVHQSEDAKVRKERSKTHQGA